MTLPNSLPSKAMIAVILAADTSLTNGKKAFKALDVRRKTSDLDLHNRRAGH